MRSTAILFWILFAFYAVLAVVYTGWNLLERGEVEWAGTVVIALCGVLSVFLAFYLSRTRSAQGGELAEDRLDANIDDGDPEIGHFSPWSWWPIVLAGAIALTFLGLAVGIWLVFIGIPLVVIALVGWQFEYYRGFFAR